MGEGNKEDLHWRYIDAGGKHPTNFSIILSDGFEVIDTDGGEKEVWLCREVDTASIRLEVPNTSGAHDLKIILDSGSISKNLLVAGCFASESSHKEEHQRGREAIQSMKSQGVRLTLALFDTTLSLPNFYRFFLEWLVEDPGLGILIKSKGERWIIGCVKKI